MSGGLPSKLVDDSGCGQCPDCLRKSESGWVRKCRYLWKVPGTLRKTRRGAEEVLCPACNKVFGSKSAYAGHSKGCPASKAVLAMQHLSIARMGQQQQQQPSGDDNEQ